MRDYISDLPVGYTKPSNPETLFLFGGYSWREGAFKLWQLLYDPIIDKFTYRPYRWYPGKNQRKLITFAGDEIKVFKTRLDELLESRGKLKSGSFDMEPFEVLRDMIRSEAYPTIGGPPQVAKVYKHLNTQYFAVLWPTSEGKPCLVGRPALPYEAMRVPILDPDRPADQDRHRDRGGLTEEEEESFEDGEYDDWSEEEISIGEKQEDDDHDLTEKE